MPKLKKIIAVLVLLLSVAMVAHITCDVVSIYAMWQKRIENMEYRQDSMQSRIDGMAYREVTK